MHINHLYLHKNSSGDYIIIKNIFRRTKLFDYLKGATTLLINTVIRDGERPDIIAEKLYGDSRLDYVVILVANLININHEWPFKIIRFMIMLYQNMVQ